MSDRRSPLSDPPSSVEQEPTMVSVPVVGSNSMWNNGDDHLDSCLLSPVHHHHHHHPECSNGGEEECSNSASYGLHSGGLDGQDSTSCEDERMMVDDERSLTVNAIVAREGSVEQESEGSEDHLAVVDNITAQNFLRESDLMNAASSALGHKKSPSGGDHSDMEKSDDLHHNLLSSDPMEMESLLREQQDLDSGAYHLPHLSPSNSSTSSLDLPSVSSSGSIGLPPVSTIIRSSAKGRFDVFCRPSNINLIMGIPQYLNSNSFDVMTSINSIQRHSPCDSLGAMEVTSSRHNDGAMDGGRCLKSNSVMSSLDGPDMMDKDEMGEMDDGFHHRTTTVPSFVALREIMHISTSPTQQARLSPPTLEEMQKVAEISEHLQSGSPFGDDGVMLSPHFSVGESNYVEGLSQRPLVSAIGTNVIMSTSNVDSSPKFTAADIKAIEQRLRTEHARNQDSLEDAGLEAEVIIPDCIETTQSSDIIYSDVQDVLSRDSEERKILKAHNIARSTIIEKNLLQQQPQVIKKESTVITSVENISLSKIITTKVSQNNNSDIITIRMAGKPTISAESHHDSLPTVNPSAVTASVIQQLLRVQTPPSTKLRTTMQRIPRGVITSTMSSKGDPIVHQDILVQSASPVNDLVSCKKDDMESGLSVPPNSILKETNLVDSGGSKDNKPVTIDIGEHSVISHGSKSPTSSADEKEAAAALPNITTTVLPSLFSNLSASALASLQSSLSSALPNISICDNSATPVSPSLSSPPLSPILLPSGILRGVASLDSIVTSSSSHAMYGGLLKMSGVVKQEPGSGPLPPFTVVSGLSPLVKQHALLGASPVAGGGQQHVVTIKQEPGSSRASVSASEFNPSIILNAALPSIASIHLPSSAAAVQLPVVVTSSATSTAALTNNPPVPSQASTIAFAAATSSSTPSSSSSAGEEAGKDKKWNSCLMCKNGSPCGLHPGGGGRGGAGGGPPQPALSGDPAKPFQCTLCGKHLASKNVYQLHLRSHSGEKPFTCSLCGHHFSQKTSLTRHMRSHTGERPFPCEVCGKRFADKERIKIHMRTHTGEKPFACEACGKRFSQKSTVKRHMSVHTGEKPFKCESCGKGFANRGNLNAHSKTHANT